MNESWTGPQARRVKVRRPRTDLQQARREIALEVVSSVGEQKAYPHSITVANVQDGQMSWARASRISADANYFAIIEARRSSYRLWLVHPLAHEPRKVKDRIVR